MQTEDVEKVLGISRITLLRWLNDGKFKGAEKRGDAKNAQWYIPVEEVERQRLKRVNELSRKIARISTSAYDYIDQQGRRLVAS